MLPFFVRTMRQADLVYLAEILTSSFHSQDGTFGWLYPVLRVGIYEDLRTRLHTPKRHYACLVAVSPDSKNGDPKADDRLIGTVEISLRRHSLNPFCGTRYLYLSNLAVQDGYRRQGVAKHLLKTCERIALDWGFADLYLHRARRLYWKAGYRLKSIDTNPVGWLLGKPRQLLLRKHLV
jgi:ribosomal protein S18 acetylase RimI-like enzyme